MAFIYFIKNSKLHIFSSVQSTSKFKERMHLY